MVRWGRTGQSYERQITESETLRFELLHIRRGRGESMPTKPQPKTPGGKARPPESQTSNAVPRIFLAARFYLSRTPGPSGTNT